MTRSPWLWLLCLAVLLAAPSAAAQERITRYDIRVDIDRDGSLQVTETIRVRAEGEQIRRGIYRDFPTRYRDRYGNRVVVDFRMIDVSRDGKPEPWSVKNRANGVRISIGDDDFLPVPGEFAYTLRYRTTRQLGFFDGHDELYWNAIGHGWVFAIDSATVEARLPEPIAADRLQVSAYTGYAGERAEAYSVSIPQAGLVRWRLSQPLAPQQGFSVVLGFPKGIVAEPTRGQRTWWLLKDNRGVLVALAGLMILATYCLRCWHRIGRDPRPGVVIARYEPPTGHTPAGLRFLRRMGYDTRCFSADLLSLAVDGKLRIQRDKGLLKDDWELERLGDAPAPAAEQQTLLDKLFPNNRKLELKNTNASTVSGAQSAHALALEKRFKPAYFNRNGGKVAVAAVIALVGGVLAFVLSGGGGILLIAGIAVLMVATLIAFALLVRAPTPAGRKLLDEIEGLRLYLGVAERDELKRAPEPDAAPMLDAQRYERLLPFAVALDVEDAWTRKFTAAAGAAGVAAATAGIAWYRGGGVHDLGGLSKAIGGQLASQISSSAHAPGSSSGSGGGGFSGGGGGGGGGGGR